MCIRDRGRKADIGGTPDYLVRLLNGNGFSFIGTQFDMCGIAAIKVESTYGADVVIDPSCVFTSRVPSAVSDLRANANPATVRQDFRVTRDFTLGRHLITAETAGRTFTPASGVTSIGNSSAAMDRRGHINFGTTATPPAAGAELFRMTFATPYPVAPEAIVGAQSTATQALGIYAKCSTTQMIVYCTNAPAASQASSVYALGWIVES